MTETLALISAETLAREYIAQAKAPNTRRGYRADWAAFTAWCQANDLDALPASAETLVGYLVMRAGAGQCNEQHPRRRRRLNDRSTPTRTAPASATVAIESGAVC